MSRANLAVRVALAASCLLIGYFSVTRTLGYVLRNGNIEQAHRLAPNDGRVTAVLAHKLFERNVAREHDRVEALARSALRQDATAVLAASTLGLDRQVQNDSAGARRVLAYADRLSRRDLQTRIWFIEDAVQRGDIPGALRHYDIALRTSRAAADLLFPVLASAIAQPDVRVALTRTLAARPVWRDNFIHYVAAQGPDAQATASLFRGMGGGVNAVALEDRVALVNSLMKQGRRDAAWAYYASYHPGADRRRSRDPRFTGHPTIQSAFDWIPMNDGGVTATIQPAEQGGIVDFSAPASVGGPVIEQLQLLPPGKYRLEGHSIDIDQTDASLPYWELSCEDGRPLGRVIVPASSKQNGLFAGQFSVPQACPSQILRLIAQPSDAVSGVSGQIDRVQLSPVR